MQQKERTRRRSIFAQVQHRAAPYGALDANNAIEQIGSVMDRGSSPNGSEPPNPGSLTEWLSTEQAARFLGIPVGSLRNKTSNGQVPYYKFGRLNRYRLSDLHGLLLSDKRGS